MKAFHFTLKSAISLRPIRRDSF